MSKHVHSCTSKTTHEQACTLVYKYVQAFAFIYTLVQSYKLACPHMNKCTLMYNLCLAVADAFHKGKYFVLGCPDLLIATDHKPLLGVFKKPLADIQNPRLLALAEKTLWFRFTVIHVPDRLNSGPDYMSRQGGSTTTKEARMCLVPPACNVQSLQHSP